MVVAFLVSTRKIHTTMSGYQVLRSTLQFLGEAAGLGKAKGPDHPYQGSFALLSSDRGVKRTSEADSCSHLSGGWVSWGLGP